MSKELPFFKFYPTEWLLGRISLESNINQIAFIKIVCMYWHKDCDLLQSDVIHLTTKERILDLSKKGYLELQYNADFDDQNIFIKFLDEQKIELNEARTKRVVAGRKGGLKTQAMLKQLDKTKIKIKNKTREDYIKEVVNNPDPNQRINIEVAEKLIDLKIERGEIIL